MAFYQFTKQQTINRSIEEVWNFISDPKNLKLITPEQMNFEITSNNLPSKMYQGMIISYRVSPMKGFRTTWVTEITHVDELKYFVDEQRIGPYKIWHHQHQLASTPEGTLMTDIISYQPPMGFLGSLMNALFIEKKLQEIFDFRFQAIEKIFPPKKHS